MEAGKANPYITHLYASFQTKHHLIYVMEFLNRGDLNHLIFKSAPLEENVIRHLTAELLCGLQFLHSKNIIHRDIKPNNILLNSAGHVRIADFGLSRMGVSESKMITECAGTPYFMAPEVLLKKPYYTIADTFSLGIVVYMMALWKHPFYDNEETREDMLWKLRETKLTYPKRMSVELCDLINRLLCKSPELRMDLVRDIRQHPFFREINWAELEAGKLPSPLKPTMVKEKFLKDNIYINELLSHEYNLCSLSSEEQKHFCDFSYVSKGLNVHRPKKIIPFYELGCCINKKKAM